MRTYILLTAYFFLFASCVSMNLTRDVTDPNTGVHTTESASYTRPMFVDQSVQEFSLSQTKTGEPLLLLKGQKSQGADMADLFKNINDMINSLIKAYTVAPVK
jgi:hypothetical protein